jgi:hypothetical protein
VDSLEGIATGKFAIETRSGTVLLLDLDSATARRYPGIMEPEKGTFSMQFENDGLPMTGVDFEQPVRVGEHVRFKCDPPMNWYISTAVLAITEQA